MSLAIAPYTAAHEPAVEAFNQRLALAGVPFKFPESQASTDASAGPITRRGFVAIQDGENVRGGYFIKEQDFWLNARRVPMGFLQLPLSEGLIDRRYSTLGVQLIAHALKRQPLLFGLGIGGRDEAFARVVAALGWQLEPVPFLFKLLRPARVARGLVAIRGTPARRAFCNAAAWTGIASLGSRILQARAARAVGRQPVAAATVEPIESLEGMGDDIWARNRHHYRLVAWRDEAALAQRYAADGRPYLRWVSRSPTGRTAWAVALDTSMSGHKYFGNLRVGTLVDCFGDVAEAPALIRGVARALAARGVDLIVSNQASHPWADALRRAGFLSGRSNFLFAASPALVKELGSLPASLGACHLTRGDGDGPINL